MSKKSNNPKGHLIVFEGPDGVGKSTVATLVAKALSARGHAVIQLSFPGRTEGSLGEIIYKLHHDTLPSGPVPMTETAKQILHIAAHTDCIATQIIPALEKGQIVILDRFWWSTIVYGLVAGVRKEALTAMTDLEKLIWDGTEPSLSLLFASATPFRDDTDFPKWLTLMKTYRDFVTGLKSPTARILNVKADLQGTVETVLELIQEYCRLDESGHSENTNKRSTVQHSGATATWNPTKPSVVLDTYWKFAAERQDIFFKRLTGSQPPWSCDPILQTFKFTNVYRASDRVSQYLIRNVIYDETHEPEDLFFRILLFKTFNKISTWDLLCKEFGSITFKDFRTSIADKLLTDAMASGQSIYSAAYIMPSGVRSETPTPKHRTHLDLLQKMMKDGLPLKIESSRSLQDVFLMLREYPFIGDFLAYQYAIDLNYSPLIDFSESSFVVPGPGAKDGIRKCFLDFGGLNEVDLIKRVTDLQETEFARLNIEFKTLWGRRLQLIDCQNVFCEVDKYSRVAHPEMCGLTGRTKIKQRYKATDTEIVYYYPPKWGINKKVEAAQQAIHPTREAQPCECISRHLSSKN